MKIIGGLERKELYGFIGVSLFNFLQGVLGVVITAVSLALFLSQFPAISLSYTYIYVGILSCILGYLLIWFSRKVSMRNVLMIPLWFLMISYLAFALWLTYFPCKSLYYFLQIWSSINFTLASFLTFSLMNFIFSLEVLKKIFGVMGSFGAIGAICGGVVLQPLKHYFSSTQIFIIAVFLHFISLVVVFFLTKNKKEERTSVSKKQESLRFSFKESKNKKYLIQILIFSIILTFLYFVLDIIFNSSCKAMYPSEKELSVFLGYFYSVTSACSLTFAIFFVSKLLKRVGIITTLMIVPIAIIIGMGGMIGFDQWGYVEIAFICLCTVRILSNVVLAESPLPLLNNPLRTAEKNWFQIQQHMILGPLSVSFAGAIILFISKFNNDNRFILSWFILLLSVLSVIVLVFLKNQYIQVLLKRISIFSKRKKERAIGKPSFEKDYLFQAIKIALNSEKKELHLLAMNQIYAEKMIEAKQILLQWMEKQQDPEELTHAVLALSRLSCNALEYQRVLQKIRGFSDFTMKNALIVFQISHHDEEVKHTFLSSCNDRCMIAFIMPYIGEYLRSEEKYALAFRLIKQLHPSKGLEGVVELLKNSANQPEAMQIVEWMGKDWVSYVKEHFSTQDQSVQEIFIQSLGVIGEKEAVELLVSLSLQVKLRGLYKVLKALFHRNFFVETEEDRAWLYQLLKNEVDYITSLKELISPLDETEHNILYGLLMADLKVAQERMFLLLSFIHPKEKMMKAWEGFISNNQEKIQFSKEILSEQMSYLERKEFLDFMLYVPSIKNPLNWKMYYEQIRRFLDISYIRSLASAFLYTMRKEGEEGLYKAMIQEAPKDDPYLYFMIDQ